MPRPNSARARNTAPYLKRSTTAYVLNTNQVQGLRKQITGLFLQGYGGLRGNQKLMARGRTLRMNGFIQGRLGQRARQVSAAAGIADGGESGERQ